MSDLFNAADAEQSPAATMETMAELERRHKSEVRKLEGEVRALVKTAKKSTKAQIETQIIRMQYELKERHQDEYDALESAAGSVVDGGDQKAALQENATDQNSDDEPDLKTDEDIAAAKKAKAKKKQVCVRNDHSTQEQTDVTSNDVCFIVVRIRRRQKNKPNYRRNRRYKLKTLGRRCVRSNSRN